MSANVYTPEDAEKINNGYTPSDDTEIIRYMNFSKFMHLITFKKLYFRNVKEFEDKYEGMMPEGFFKNWDEKSAVSYRTMIKILDKVRTAYASCWNSFENTESYALWRIYTDPDAGIAIKSSIKRLRTSLNDDDLKIYTVRYLKSFDDKNEDIEIPFVFKEDSFYRVKEACKLNTYGYEKEIRAIKFGKTSESGIELSVDTNELINEIYLSPFANEWFKELVKEIIAQPIYGLTDKKINNSKIVIS